MDLTRRQFLMALSHATLGLVQPEIFARTMVALFSARTNNLVLQPLQLQDLIPAERASSEIFREVFLARNRGKDRTKAFMTALMMQTAYKHDPELEPEEAITKIRSMVDEAFAAEPDLINKLAQTEDRLYEYLIDKIGTIPGGNLLVPDLKFIYHEFFRDAIKNQTDGGYSAVQAMMREAGHSRGTSYLIGDSLVQLWTMAGDNPKLALVYDSFFGGSVAPSGATIKEMLEQNSDIAALQILRQLELDGDIIINQLGDIEIKVDRIGSSLEKLKVLTQIGFTELGAQLTEINTKVDQLLAQGDYLVAGVGTLLKAEAERQEQEREAQEHQLKLQGLGSGVSILATITGFFDPELGKSLSVLGNGAITIGESVSQLGATIGAAGLLNWGVIIATGNILGAFVSIYSLLASSSEPDPDQVILTEIGRVQSMIIDLAGYMAERFNRVDQALHTIFFTLTSLQDRVIREFSELDTMIRGIYTEILDIDKKLRTVETNILRVVTDLHEFDLKIIVDEALKPSALVSEDDFDRYEVAFYNWATQASLSSPYSFPAEGKSVDPYDWLDELKQANQVLGNLNYLQKASGGNWDRSPLPNLNTLSIALFSYVSLMTDYPDYMARRSTPARMSALLNLSKGCMEILQSAVSKELFQWPLSKYKEAFDAILARAGEYKQSLNLPFDVFLSNEAIYAWVEKEGYWLPSKIVDWSVPTYSLPGSSVPFTYELKPPSPQIFGDMFPRAPAYIAHLLVEAFNRMMESDHQFPSFRNLLGASVHIVKPQITIEAPFDCVPGQELINCSVDVIVTSWFGDKKLKSRRGPRAVASTITSEGETLARKIVEIDFRGWQSFYEQSVVTYEDPDAFALLTRHLEVQLDATRRAILGFLAAKIVYATPVDPIDVEIHGNPHWEAKKLSGSVALLRAYCIAALPRAHDLADFLRAHLYGQFSILDEDSKQSLSRTFYYASLPDDQVGSRFLADTGKNPEYDILVYPSVIGHDEIGYITTANTLAVYFGDPPGYLFRVSINGIRSGATTSAFSLLIGRGGEDEQRHQLVLTIDVYDPKRNKTLATKNIYSDEFLENMGPQEFSISFQNPSDVVVEHRIYYHGNFHIQFIHGWIGQSPTREQIYQELVGAPLPADNRLIFQKLSELFNARMEALQNDLFTYIDMITTGTEEEYHPSLRAAIKRLEVLRTRMN